MMPVTILYEDSAADGDVRNYGPHRLVVQCVADRLGVQAWELRTLTPVPKRSASKLRNECKRIPARFGRDGSWIIAVYDSDRIRPGLGLDSSCCKALVRERLRDECAWGEHLGVVLLERNVESLIEAVQRCSPTLVDEGTWKAALAKKLNARDIVLGKAAKPPQVQIRACVLREVPSLAYLIEVIIRLGHEGATTRS
jgi:hypothetical protein